MFAWAFPKAALNSSRAKLLEAIKINDEGKVRKILSKSSIELLQSMDPDTELTPLRAAIVKQNINIVKLLLEYGANANETYEKVRYYIASTKLA